MYLRVWGIFMGCTLKNQLFVIVLGKKIMISYSHGRTRVRMMCTCDCMFGSCCTQLSACSDHDVFAYVGCPLVDPDVCRNAADVVFVIDSSGSIENRNFDLIIEFVTLIVDELNIESGAVRVGAMTFSNVVIRRFDLNEFNTR